MATARGAEAGGILGVNTPTFWRGTAKKCFRGVNEGKMGG